MGKLKTFFSPNNEKQQSIATHRYTMMR